MPERDGTLRNQGDFVLVLTASCQGEDFEFHLTNMVKKMPSTMLASIFLGVGRRVNMWSVLMGKTLTGTWVERRNLPVAG